MKRLFRVLFILAAVVVVSVIGSQGLQALTEDSAEEQLKRWEEMEYAGETSQGENEEELSPEDEGEAPEGEEIGEEDPEDENSQVEEPDTPDTEDIFNPDMKDQG